MIALYDMIKSALENSSVDLTDKQISKILEDMGPVFLKNLYDKYRSKSKNRVFTKEEINRIVEFMGPPPTIKEFIVIVKRAAVVVLNLMLLL